MLYAILMAREVYKLLMAREVYVTANFRVCSMHSQPEDNILNWHFCSYADAHTRTRTRTHTHTHVCVYIS